MASTLIELDFQVENLGSVRAGKFTHKPLTIFCGPNNTGKTWTLYSLYHFYQQLALGSVDMYNDRMTLDSINEIVASGLVRFFNASLAQLNSATFSLVHDPGCLPELADALKMRQIFLIPAERSGLNLFFRELSSRRTALLHHASQPNIDLGKLLSDVINSPYAAPIADYIDWLNRLPEMQKSKSSDGHIYADHIKRSLTRGSYSVDPNNGAINFRPYRTRQDKLPPVSLGLHMTSSTVKSLFGLWFYLEHQAQPGDILMTDEPELNIHPDNQRKIARLLARLVNAGINIVISTHSDYIVRELNSLIMLSQDQSGELRKKHNYDVDEVLRPEQIGAYLFDQRRIKAFKIVPSDGIYATNFDEVIADLNKVNDDIYYSLQEQYSDQVND